MSNNRRAEDNGVKSESSPSVFPKSSIVVQLIKSPITSFQGDHSDFEDDNIEVERDEEDMSPRSTIDLPVKVLSEHDYYEDYETERPALIGASELVGEDDSSDEDEMTFDYIRKANVEKFQQKTRNRIAKHSEVSEGASRIINLAFEKAVRQAINSGAALPTGYSGRRCRNEDPMCVTKEELKQRLDDTANELRPLMATGMMSHNDTHGLMHNRELWAQLKIDKKLLANLFWEARQQATTSQPGPAYARYTLVAFYSASEGLTYPQAASRCSISYTTAIEYIALCEVRHYFGEQVAKEIHEFTMQQVDVDDLNCMRAWSNNCAKFLNDHRRQRETKKNADLARASDCRLYIHLKGDKRPFRIQKLQNFFLKQNPADGNSFEESRSSIVADDGSAQPAPKKQRRSTKKPRTSLVDIVDAKQRAYDGLVESEADEGEVSPKDRRKTKPSKDGMPTVVIVDWDRCSLPVITPPTPWNPCQDPFFLKSVTDMMQTPADVKKASDVLLSLSRHLLDGVKNMKNSTVLIKTLTEIQEEENNTVD